MSIPGTLIPLFNSGAAVGGYQVQRSIRLNSADSAYLSRTPGSASNRKTWTWAGWVKRSKLGTTQRFFATFDGSNQEYWRFDSNDTLRLFESLGTLQTTQVFRDVSAWYHIVVAVDTTQATTSDRIKFYLNGTQVTTFSTATYPSQNADGRFNSTVPHYLGTGTVEYFDGYLAECFFLDGIAADPSSFTETDATTGQLIPKAYTGSYGSNGWKLSFSDNSTAAALGTDSSSNGNTWTVNNLSVTAGSGNDSLVDTPTSYGTDTGVGGEVRGNYATFNPTESSTSGTKTLTNGNLDVLLADANAARLTIPPIQGSGKYQWEITIGSKTASFYQMGLNLLSMVYASGDLHTTFRSDGNLSNTLSGSWSGTGVSYTSGDIITVTYDNATNACAFYKNGVYSATFTVSGTPQSSLNFGVFYGGSGNTNYILNAGQRAFAYPVSGFKALCDTNLGAPVVAKPNTVMDVKTWTGDGTTGTGSITGFAFSPDFVWAKSRSAAYSHLLYDTVRGASTSGSSKALGSNASIAEGSSNDNTTYGYLSSFNSDGFSYFGGSSPAYFSANGGPYVAWTWDAGTSTVTNTAGSISSQVRANASAGFSVVSWTGTGASASIGHGLGVAPTFAIIKRRDSAQDWYVTTTVISGLLDYLALNKSDASAWTGVSVPSSTVFTLGTGASNNASGATYVGYCFAPVSGYSSFGSYVGNGSADGPMVWTGFRPRWILVKNTSVGGEESNWYIYDTQRDTYNIVQNYLIPNLSLQEQVFAQSDFLSNGFKVRNTNANFNTNGNVYIYAAFAENPFQYARAR